MGSHSFHRLARACFVCLLVFGLTAVLVSLLLVHYANPSETLEEKKEEEKKKTPHELHAHSAAHNAIAAFPSDSSSAHEVTVAVIGRLCNHMFEYASLLGLAHQNRRRPFGSPRLSLHEVFEVTHIRDQPSTGFKAVYENDFATYDPSLNHLPRDNVVLCDYLQSWKYFHPIRDTIRKEFTFKARVKERAERLLNKSAAAASGKKVRVGIHVRRGDMASAYSRRRGYYTAPVSYLFNAMDHMRKKHGQHIVFLVVSDDLRWCRKALRGAPDVVIVESAPGEVHLALLTSCDHVIMTVGTYGWWGGWLSGGDVVYYWDPKVCVHQPPLEVEIKRPEDFFPPHWLPLPG